MSSWKTTKLRNKIHVKHGFPFKSEFFREAGDYVVLTPGNFHEEGGFKRNAEKDKCYSHTFPPEYLLRQGDLIVAMTEQAEGLLGSTAQIPRNNQFLHNQRLGLITAKDNDIDLDYLFHLFKTKSVRSQIRLSSSGSKVKHTSPERIYDVQVQLPPLPTQQKIAKVLATLDAKIALNNRINAELEAMAKLLYDYWFVQFDFPMTAAQAAALGQAQLEGQPYKSSGGKMVFNPTLKREIPEGWEVGNLLDIANYINGIACQKYRPTSDESLPVIKIREMRDGFTKSTERVGTHIPDKVKVSDGDVLFSWSASLEVIIWTGGEGGLNQHIFKVTSEKFPRSYFYHQLSDYLAHFKMIADLRKTTMGHITQDHLNQSRISIPPTECTSAFDAQVRPIQEASINHQKQNQELTTLRDWLLPMLMNGQVAVN